MFLPRYASIPITVHHSKCDFQIIVVQQLLLVGGSHKELRVVNDTVTVFIESAHDLVVDLHASFDVS